RELQMHGLCRELALEYLTEDAVLSYLGARFPEREVPRWFARLIHRRTEGNPLFLVNLVDHLLSEGLIARDSGPLVAGPIDAVDSCVPENIRQLIERQIERLSDDERRVLEAASVAGMECSVTAIAAGLAELPEWVEQRCESLARRHQFLTPARLVELPDGTV